MTEKRESKKTSFLQRVATLQETIRVTKNRVNAYGGYRYRSLEDIFEELKKHIKELQLVLKIEDDVVQVGDRYYVKATATLIDTEAPASISVTAYAREADLKKGMDAAQITGAASSYARKYALSALLLLDDVQDADAQAVQTDQGASDQTRVATEQHVHNREQTPSKPNPSVNNKSSNDWDRESHNKMVLTVTGWMEQGLITQDDIKKVLLRFGMKDFGGIKNRKQAIAIYKALEAKKKEKEGQNG